MMLEGMRRFEGARVVVTGGAHGLGLGVVRRFLAEGAAVWLADVDPAAPEIAAAEGAAGGVVCDVSDAAAVDRLFAEVAARHGGVDVVFANAGVGGGAPLAEMTDELWHRVTGVDLDGVFFTIRAAARLMIPAGSGAIVTVGSIYGRDTPARSGAYGAAKAGVVALTQAAARELAPHGIRVNCICPGHMDTAMYDGALRRRAAARGISYEAQVAAERAMVPLGRLGTGEDVGGLVAFLASPDASYLTGQTINLDGGLQPR